MAADVLDEHQNFCTFGERAAVHRAGLLVDRFVAPHAVDQTVERLFSEDRIGWQLDGVNFSHQCAEYRALAAARGDGAFFHAAVEVGNAVARGDSDRVDIPVDLH